MILFAGVPSEPPLRLAIAAAERLGVSHAVLNQRRMKWFDLCVDFRADAVNGKLWLDERRLELGSFAGAYTRIVAPGALPEFRPTRISPVDAGELARADLFLEALDDWLEASAAVVVNRPSAMVSNGSKPYQARLIRSCGFETPSTLVTNEPELVREFWARHGRIVYKSISGVRSIVKEWRLGENEALEKIRALPTQFQALTPGTDVRVHVVGDRVFATEIRSRAIDYRYASQEEALVSMHAVNLPPWLEEKCVSMTAALGLAFSGIDLRHTPDDRWVCFEVNTSPGYSYFQEQTGQVIADALVLLLAEPRSQHRVVAEVTVVQPIENRADLVGRIVNIREDPDRPEHKLATLDVSGVTNVESYPNLLGGANGSHVDVIIPTAQTAAIKTGDVVRCRARRAAPSIVYAKSCEPFK